MTHNEINACYTFLTAVADAMEYDGSLSRPVTVTEAALFLNSEFRCDPIMVWGIATTWQATRYGVVLPSTPPSSDRFRYTAPAGVPFDAEFTVEKNAPTMNFSVYNPNELR